MYKREFSDECLKGQIESKQKAGKGHEAILHSALKIGPWQNKQGASYSIWNKLFAIEKWRECRLQ